MGNRRHDPDFNVKLCGWQWKRAWAFARFGITFGVVKGQDAAFVGRVAPNSPEAELKRLRKENERLQRERAILKKQWPSSQWIRIVMQTHNRAPLRVRSAGDVPRS